MLQRGISGLLKLVRSKISRLCGRPRLLLSGIAGIVLLSSLSGLFLQQRQGYQTQALHPSPVQSLLWEDQRSARSVASTLLPETTLFYQTVSPLPETASKKIASFTRNVLGYSEMPDQCKPKPGFSQPSTRTEFAMSNYGPYRFLPEYRNPCWRHPQSKQLRCLPFFYLAGFPKCGTTDMYLRITRHPMVTESLKEYHWVTRTRFRTQTVENYTMRYGFYMSERSTNEKLCILGDGSASTAWDNHVWQLLPGNERCTEPRIINADHVRHMNPNVKIIMMMRNPTSRLYSGFMFFDRQGRLERTSDIFHDLVLQSIDAFEKCRRTQSLRSCVYSKSTIPLHVGMYSVFVEDWLLRFPRDQLLFLRLEDVHDGSAMMPTIFNFLGVEVPDNATMQTIVNLGHRNVGKLAKKSEPMWNSTRAILDAFYRPFNDRLAKILQDSRFTWRGV